MTILEEAEAIVSNSRRNDYGHPLDNWTDTAAIWSVQLRKKLKEPITAEEAVQMMIAVKLAREAHSPKRDNRTDIAGYARCLEMIDDERERRESPSSESDSTGTV